MSSPSQLESFTAGAETAVDVAQIERQLHQLWQAAADAAPEPERRAITRASLFNLVAWCPSEADRDRASLALAALTSRHPCRAILLLAEPAAPTAPLAASITAHCHLAGGGGKQVCCEQITLHAAGDAVEHLAPTTLALLESDLPTVVWWPGNFLREPRLFARVGALADRLVFDTSLWAEGGRDLAPLALTLTAFSRCTFSDLSWTRLAFWRALTADVFDAPACAAELGSVRAVEIEHGRGPGAALRAALYAGWLAARLGWTVDQARALVRRRAAAVAGQGDTGAAGLLRVRLTTAHAQFEIFKNHGERTASTVVQLPAACELPRKRAFWPDDDVSLLSHELDHPAPPTSYEEALAIAAALLR